MTTVKRHFSLAFRNAIEPIMQENRALYEQRTSPNELFRLVDVSPGSDFYFFVEAESNKGQGVTVKYGCKPMSTEHQQAFASTETLAHCSTRLRTWFKLIEQYGADSILDDSITSAFRNEFYDDWRIVDEGADYTPFMYPDQLLLIDYLEEVENFITREVEPVDSEKAVELRKEVALAKSAVSSQAKNVVMKRLSTLWAKARKGGLKWSGWMLKKFAEKVFDKAVEVGFKYAADHALKLPAYIERIERIITAGNGG